MKRVVASQDVVKTYSNEYSEVDVREVTRKYALEYATSYVEDARDGLDPEGDISVYIEYIDGDHFYCCGDTEEGRFRKRAIHGIIISDSGEYTVYGKYKVNENLIPEII